MGIFSIFRRDRIDPGVEAAPAQRETEAEEGATPAAVEPEVSELDDSIPRQPFGPISVPAVVGTQVEPIMVGGICQSMGITQENWQINVSLFSAPRSGNWWIRIAEQMQGAEPDKYTVITTPHGPELFTAGADNHPPMRIGAIDAPGYVLRVAFIGAVATDDEMRARAWEYARQIEVNRPQTALLPGELIPLQLPQMPGVSPVVDA